MLDRKLLTGICSLGVRRPARLAQSERTLLSGLSVVPGFTALLVQSLRERFDDLHTIRTFVAPGTSGSRGAATIRSLLAGVGRPLRLLRDGRVIIEVS